MYMQVLLYNVEEFGWNTPLKPQVGSCTLLNILIEYLLNDYNRPILYSHENLEFGKAQSEMKC